MLDTKLNTELQASDVGLDFKMLKKKMISKQLTSTKYKIQRIMSVCVYIYMPPLFYSLARLFSKALFLEYHFVYFHISGGVCINCCIMLLCLIFSNQDKLSSLILLITSALMCI